MVGSRKSLPSEIKHFDKKQLENVPGVDLGETPRHGGNISTIVAITYPTKRGSSENHRLQKCRLFKWDMWWLPGGYACILCKIYNKKTDPFKLEKLRIPNIDMNHWWVGIPWGWWVGIPWGWWVGIPWTWLWMVKCPHPMLAKSTFRWVAQKIWVCLSTTVHYLRINIIVKSNEQHL